LRATCKFSWLAQATWQELLVSVIASHYSDTWVQVTAYGTALAWGCRATGAERTLDR